jgi:hypothetical protein
VICVAGSAWDAGSVTVHRLITSELIGEIPLT